MFGLSGRSHICPSMLVILQFVAPCVIEQIFIAANSWIERRGRRGKNLGGCDTVLIVTMDGGMHCVGTVAVLPVGPEVATDHGYLAFPLVLDLLHRRVDGSELKVWPCKLPIEGANYFTLLFRKRSVFELGAENDGRTRGVIRTRIGLKKYR